MSGVRGRQRSFRVDADVADRGIVIVGDGRHVGALGEPGRGGDLIREAQVTPREASIVATIVNELVANASKHSFARSSGTIPLNGKRVAEAGYRLMCSVDAELRAAEAVSLGRRVGLELKILKASVRQLGGTMTATQSDEGYSTLLDFNFSHACNTRLCPPSDSPIIVHQIRSNWHSVRSDCPLRARPDGKYANYSSGGTVRLDRVKRRGHDVHYAATNRSGRGDNSLKGAVTAP